MKNFDAIKQKYIEKGMKEKNIDYAIDAVKYKVKRELIIENLTSKYRNELPEVSNLLLDEVYDANGGEFKYRNRRLILWGILAIIAAVLGLINHNLFWFYDMTFYIFWALMILVFILGLLLIFIGIFTNHKKDAFGDLD